MKKAQVNMVLHGSSFKKEASYIIKYVQYGSDTNLQSSMNVNNVTCKENLKYIYIPNILVILIYLYRTYVPHMSLITCECNCLINALLESPVHKSCHHSNLALCSKGLLPLLKYETCPQIDRIHISCISALWRLTLFKGQTLQDYI